MDDTQETAGTPRPEPAAGGLREPVGYLKGRGGPETAMPEATKAEIREQFAEIRRSIDDLEAQALELEDAMAGVGAALTRTQPPMYRRMMVRWWRMRGGQRREPVMVRVEAGPHGRAKLVPAEPAMRLRVDRGFGLCADLAKSVVRGYWALRTVRREIQAEVAALNRLVKPSARRAAVIIRVRDEAAESVREASGRLRDVGYDVPEEEIAEAD